MKRLNIILNSKNYYSKKNINIEKNNNYYKSIYYKELDFIKNNCDNYGNLHIRVEYKINNHIKKEKLNINKNLIDCYFENKFGNLNLRYMKIYYNKLNDSYIYFDFDHKNILIDNQIDDQNIFNDYFLYDKQ